jgi:hypothetical protein
MIRTTELRRAAFGLSHHRGRMMAADIEKPAEFAVVAANYDNRLAADFSCDVITGVDELVRTRGELPGIAEDSLGFNFKKFFVRVPG